MNQLGRSLSVKNTKYQDLLFRLPNTFKPYWKQIKKPKKLGLSFTNLDPHNSENPKPKKAQPVG